MTTIEQWRALLADVDAATGPIDINEAHQIAKQCFPYEASDAGETEQERNVTDSRIDARNGLQGSLDAAVALVEREMPESWWEVTRSLNGYGAWVSVPMKSTGALVIRKPTAAIALLLAFIKAKIAELEQDVA